LLLKPAVEGVSPERADATGIKNLYVEAIPPLVAARNDE
jgi:hypothetical protein